MFGCGVPGDRCQATGARRQVVPGDRCQATGASDRPIGRINDLSHFGSSALAQPAGSTLTSERVEATECHEKGRGPEEPARRASRRRPPTAADRRRPKIAADRRRPPPTLCPPGHPADMPTRPPRRYNRQAYTNPPGDLTRHPAPENVCFVPAIGRCPCIATRTQNVLCCMGSWNDKWHNCRR